MNVYKIESVQTVTEIASKCLLKGSDVTISTNGIKEKKWMRD